MKTTFDNIEYIIMKLVEYQVKSWCSDVRYDGTTKLLPLHPLSVAKHIAYDCGWCKRDFGGRNKEISAHMRPYNHIKELSPSVARKIISCLDDDTYYYAGAPRYDTFLMRMERKSVRASLNILMRDTETIRLFSSY